MMVLVKLNWLKITIKSLNKLYIQSLKSIKFIIFLTQCLIIQTNFRKITVTTYLKAIKTNEIRTGIQITNPRVLNQQFLDY